MMWLTGEPSIFKQAPNVQSNKKGNTKSDSAHTNTHVHSLTKSPLGHFEVLSRCFATVLIHLVKGFRLSGLNLRLARSSEEQSSTFQWLHNWAHAMASVD
eukprot:627163-Amphidinium_carterae.1